MTGELETLHDDFRRRFETIMEPWLRYHQTGFLYEAALADLLAGKLVIIRHKQGCYPVAESR